MKTYLIITAVSSSIIRLYKVLSLGRFIMLWAYKRMHSYSSLEEFEDCEKQSKSTIFFPINKSES